MYPSKSIISGGFELISAAKRPRMIARRTVVLAVLLTAAFVVQASAHKLGSQFQVNTYTTDLQTHAAVAGLAPTGFVVVWESENRDGAKVGLYGRRYHANGRPAGDEFTVSNVPATYSERPAVAALSGGGFVVVWHVNTDKVYGQRFDEAGGKLGDAFQVNTKLADSAFGQYPSVAGLSGGGFIVVWRYGDADGDAEIHGQLFDAAGQWSGREFRVNRTKAGYQNFPTVAALTDGGFVAAWHSLNEGGSGYDIYAQRFDSLGQRSGRELSVNTYKTNDQAYPSVAGLTDGGFVIAWHSEGQDGSYNGVYGQRFDELGHRFGREFRINTYTSLWQEYPAVAGLTDGDYIATWESFGQDDDDNQDGTWAVYGQRFTAAGPPSYREFLVNTYTPGQQRNPSVGALSDGGFVVCWDGRGPDTGQVGFGLSEIYCQRWGPKPSLD
jgi:hypothetical protein